MKNSVALNALRRYHESAPWRLAELIELADSLMGDAGLPREKPTTERTVRFYVARGVVHPPYGRGAGSSWGYRHLIDLIAVRLSQQAGETLETIADFRGRAGETGLEQMVAERLGPAFFRPRLVRDATPVAEPLPRLTTEWHRIALGDGAELQLAAGHPLLSDINQLRAIVARIRELTHPTPQESS
ncbi:MAG: hypothetical protein ABIZ70_08130 [Gemmatimonadales bacterium]